MIRVFDRTTGIRVAAGLAAALTTAAAGAAPCLPERGQQIFESKCAMCHAVKKEQGHMAGPNLAGVFGRPIGKAPGFQYSPVLGGAKDNWDAKALDIFLKAPATARPGTTMPFSGIRNDADRTSVACYLDKL